jgi:hypothetical protein
LKAKPLLGCLLNDFDIPRLQRNPRDAVLEGLTATPGAAPTQSRPPRAHKAKSRLPSRLRFIILQSTGLLTLKLIYSPPTMIELNDEFGCCLARSGTFVVVAKDEGLSGNAFFEAVAKKLSKVDDDIRFPSTSGGCFIKGTRVQTQQGLKRIEDIKVGDYVLSSPEDGTGKPEYKRVVNTFVHSDKTITSIGYYKEGSNQARVLKATGNHPFWVEGLGWTRADLLEKH